jgi:hypothetical protein
MQCRKTRASNCERVCVNDCLPVRAEASRYEAFANAVKGRVMSGSGAKPDITGERAYAHF